MYMNVGINTIIISNT